jgi:Dolichyl-phosphate-mannose-protein mannosyltransferase
MLPLFGALIVAFVSLWQSSEALHTSFFHPDESRWINRSDYLSELGHPLSSFWSDAYLIRGQPPMGSYITGLGLFIQGQSLNQNQPWNFSFGNDGDIDWNVTHGAMPNASVLLDARKTSIAISLLLCLTTYLIVMLLSNWIGGVVAGAFLGIHPLTVYLATLAVSDMAFTWIVALSVLTSIWLVRRPGWFRTLLLGLTLGAGASLKLSPIFVSIGLAAVGGLILATPFAQKIRPLRWLWNHLAAETPPNRRVAWMLISLPFIASFVFVASYPYLWSDPVGRTQVLFDFRRAEMASQSRIWGDQAIKSRPEAVERTWNMLEHRYSTSGKILAKLTIKGVDANGNESGYDLPFALAGVLIFIAIALKRGFRTPHLMALLVLGGQTLIIILGINIDFNRYYLPIAFFFAIGLGVGAGSVIDGGLYLLRRLGKSRVTALPQAVDLSPAD